MGTRARAIVQPAFRPVGTQGLALDSVQRETLLAHATKSHAQPIVDVGPAELPVVYVIPADGYDIVVNGDHLLTWGIEPVELQDAAMRNLAAGRRRRRGRTRPRASGGSSARRPAMAWMPSASCSPRWSAHLARGSGPGRILIGIPERHLLTAASLRPGDDEFATMFGEFIVEHSGGADEPIDRRVFELVDGRIVEFA